MQLAANVGGESRAISGVRRWWTRKIMISGKKPVVIVARTARVTEQAARAGGEGVMAKNRGPYKAIADAISNLLDGVKLPRTIDKRTWPELLTCCAHFMVKEVSRAVRLRHQIFGEELVVECCARCCVRAAMPTRKR